LPGEPGADPTGFDTGPANCLMDAWARRHLGQAYDRDGTWAAGAEADRCLLAALLADPYFSAEPPKSTGTQHFSTAWLDAKLAVAPGLDPATVQATLLALTTESVATAIAGHAPATKRVLVCGGGAHNTALMRHLAARLALPVESTANHGIDPDWMEAMAFAWLAQQTLAGRPGNLPSVTGAAGPRILGAIHPA
jgi:anhydro-N-acetylmuramic acid kinase